MSEQSRPKITCPECGQRYRWKSHHAGHRTRCAKCQAKLQYPEEPGQPFTVIESGGVGPQGGGAESQQLDPDELRKLKEQAKKQGAAWPVRQDSPDAHRDPNRPKRELHPFLAPEAGEEEDEEKPATVSGGNAGSEEAGKPNSDEEKTSPEEGEDTYELADDPDAGVAKPSAADHGGQCPKCGAQLKPTAVVCTNCGFDLATNRNLQTEKAPPSEESGEEAAGEKPEPSLIEQQQNAEEPAYTSTFQSQRKRDEARRQRAEEYRHEMFRKWEYAYPAYLLAIALVVQALNTFFWLGQAGVAGVGNLLAAASVQVGLFVPLAAAVLVIADSLNMPFHSYGSGLVKLSAITLLSHAVATLLAGLVSVTMAILLWPLVAAATVWLLVTVFFRLEPGDRLYFSGMLLGIDAAGLALVLYGLPVAFGGG